jgi:hypothetical protein
VPACTASRPRLSLCYSHFVKLNLTLVKLLVLMKPKIATLLILERCLGKTNLFACPPKGPSYLRGSKLSESEFIGVNRNSSEFFGILRSL